MIETITARISDIEIENQGASAMNYIVYKLANLGIPVSLEDDSLIVTSGILTWQEDFEHNSTIFIWRQRNENKEKDKSL